MIVVVDFGMGNVGSILNMFKRLGVPAGLSPDPAQIAAADKLVLPGVGAFDRGMDNLASRGLVDVLTRRVLDDGVPILGICLGMQLMTRGSEEGRRPGLGWIDAHTVHIKKDAGEGARHLKIPHIGWNFIEPVRAHALLQDLPEDPRFYFVHTYKAVCASRDDVLAETDYGDGRFTSAFAAGNLAGVQFHPEKSHLFGMQLFRNFAAWQGATAREAARG